ncbi:MAG: tRNA pseudouridine(38-40) synthase TruA [Terriglobia bacterium]
MRNLRLDIAYDGTDFSGWQRQPDRVTIQGCIEAAVARITGESVSLAGSGRTDAGVHAAGQVANFKIASPIPPDNLKRALNNALPETIRILRVKEAPPEFHARYNAMAKLYRYRILQTDVCPPYLARFVLHYAGQLDRKQMQRAAQWMEGEHDFTSLAAAIEEPGSAGDESGQTSRAVSRAAQPAVRVIFSSRMVWNPATSIVTYEARGNGFLRHMVRTIAGTLIEVGRGAIPAQDIPSILEARDRSKAGPTAAARGLCLVRVEY